MKKTVLSKMLLSAILAVCISMTAAGCVQSENSENSNVTSTASTAQSLPVAESAESSVESIVKIPVENSIESISEISAETSDNSNFEETSVTESADAPENTVIVIDYRKRDTLEWLNEISFIFKNAGDDEGSKNDLVEPSAYENTDNEKNDGNIIVMLDPGHDDDENCSARNHKNIGLNEQDLNLKIGLACYDRLKQYKGVTPLMTRYDGQCPNSDKMFPEDVADNHDCIHKRAYIAEQANADVFISLHCNALTNKDEIGSPASGTDIYITNYTKFAAESNRLANLILKHISSAVDLSPRDVLSEEAYDKEKGYFKGFYDDGTVKDKFYLISHNIDYGRPAIVVEHAFMDNAHDNAILKDDEQLKLIGQADADAIAEYYGLELK